MINGQNIWLWPEHMIMAITYNYGQNIWLWPEHMIMARTNDYGQNIWLMARTYDNFCLFHYELRYHRSNHFILHLLLELSENVMVVDKHFQKDIEMLQMT
jgi:hypothetical protein